MLQGLCRLAALLCFLAIVPAAAEPPPLLVVQIADLAGPAADFARDYSLGAKVCFDHANAAGGIAGRRLAYRLVGAVPGQTAAAAQGALRDGAQVLFGPVGDEAAAALLRDPAVAAAQVPVFAPVTAGTLPAGEVYPLRAGLEGEMRALAAHLAPLGLVRVAVAASPAFARAAAIAEAELVRQGSLKVIARADMPAGAEGPAAAAENLARSRPQAVVVLADTLSVAQFARRYRQLDPGVLLATSSLANVRTLVAAVGHDAARGLVVSQVVPPPGGVLEAAREHRRLMERYADEPPSHATFEGCLAARSLVQALRRSRDTTRPAVTQALREAGDFDLGGFRIRLARGERASSHVELTVVGRDGQLLR